MLRIVGEAGRAERPTVAGPAQAHGVEPLGAGNVRDALAPLRDEMLDRELGAALVVGDEATARSRSSACE